MMLMAKCDRRDRSWLEAYAREAEQRLHACNGCATYAV